MTARTKVHAETAPAPLDEPATPNGNVTSLDALGKLLETDDRPIESVEVPEWPGRPTVYLRGISGAQRDEMEVSMSRVVGKMQLVFFDNVSAKLVARSLCTPEGEPLVPRERMAEFEKQLAGRRAGGLYRLFRVAQRLSGLGDDDIEEMAEGLKADRSKKRGTG
jgi:hypothetical protein